MSCLEWNNTPRSFLCARGIQHHPQPGDIVSQYHPDLPHVHLAEPPQILAPGPGTPGAGAFVSAFVQHQDAFRKFRALAHLALNPFEHGFASHGESDMNC